MSDLLAMVQHLLNGAIASPGLQVGPLAVRAIEVQPAQVRVDGWLDLQNARGTLRLTAEIEVLDARRHVLHVTVDEAPELLVEPLEAFRPLIETLRLHIDLDWPPDSEVATGAGG
jgi:hypothetical protein